MTSPSDPPGERLGGRLHPAAIGVWSVAAVGPGALLLLGGGPTVLVAVAVLVATTLLGAVRYLRFEWSIVSGTLVIDQGLFQRRRRVIPLQRIQSVQLVRSLRHRLFGVVEVRVETVGASDTEGRLDALRPDVAEAVRSALLRRRPDDASEAPPRTLLAALTPGRLVLAGVTGGRVGVAAALIGAGQEVAGDRIVRLLPLIDPTDNLDGALGVVAVVAIGAFLLSIAATVLTYWNFTLTADDTTLHVRRGLLDERAETLPRNRIQAVWVEENAVRRVLGLATVRVDVAGRAGDQDARVSAVLLPLGSRAQAHALVQRLLHRPDGEPPVLQPMPATARRRRLVRAGLAVAVIAAGGVLDVRLVAVAAVAAPVLAAAALSAYRALGWARDEDLTITRSGVLVRRTAHVRDANLQSLSLGQTPFQRRLGLATLRLEIARSPGGRDPRLTDVAASDGRRLLHELRTHAQGSHSATGR